MNGILLLLVSLCCSAIATGATFYIDYETGLDTNAGTTKGAPWKRCPSMKGFSGAYAHRVGDRFVFKGGRIWPRGCFQMLIASGGSSDSTRDYYGSDADWYSGSSFKKPVFDFENTLIPGFGQTSAGVQISSASYITLEGIELANHRGQNDDNESDGSSPGFCASTIVLTGTVSDVTIQGCIVRDWDIPLVGGLQPVGTVDGGSGGIMMSAWSGGGARIKILNNEIHQQNSPTKSGYALYLYGEIAGNHIHHTSDVLVGGGNIHDNIIHHVTDATDIKMHEDVLYCTSPSRVFNNVIYTTTSAAPVIYLEPSRSSASGSTLVYNNVCYDTGYPPVSIDIASGSGANHSIRILNNTLATASSSCVRVVNRNNALGSLELRNNHYITNSAVKDIPNGTVANLAESNNLTQSLSVASATGANSGNTFRPLSGPAINSGVDLSAIFSTDRLGTVRIPPWDIGAYEFGGSAPVEPPFLTGMSAASGIVATQFNFRLIFSGNPTSYTATPLPAGLTFDTATGIISGTVGAPMTSVISVSATNTQGTGLASVSLSFTNPAEPTLTFSAPSGVVSGFVVSNGGISQQIEAVSSDLGGLAIYAFNLPTGGNYILETILNAPTDSENSFFVNIDSEPTGPQMIWDIPVSSGFESRTASWRGNGTYAVAQYDPKVFSLSAGSHRVVIRGREANTVLKQVTLKPYLLPPSSPKNIRITTVLPE